MSDTRQWLEELGLGQYADAFEENGVDQVLLAELTNEDLKDIGVARLADRKIILKAIATAFGEQSPPKGADPAVSEANKNTVREAERRQITVMFCDLVGSTALSEALDPEDLREVMAAYQQTAGAVIERYQGHVAQYLGDGLMTYFGWPQAHEDDAVRAVRAGLEIVEAVQGVASLVALSVRVGISTGPVVVGETGAGDAAVPKAAVGETPNVAARVQGLAEPNTVTIGEATRRLIGGAFYLEDLGAQSLKGVATPIKVFRVTGASDVETRFDASHGAGLTPMIARDEEIGLLLKRWEQAKDGESQVVLLSGEAGIGKSRIAQALREHVATEAHVQLRYQCSPYYANSAFYPVIDQLKHAAKFKRDDSLETGLDKLEALLARSADNMTDVVSLFAALLSLPLDRYPALALSPQKQKENTIAALADLVAGLAGAHPVLMLFEDAHWCDPTTLEVLGAVIERVRESAVLVLITFRPEFEPPWAGQGTIGTLTLNRLSRRQGAEMVAEVTGGRTLPDDVLDQIVAKTDGVPLFVEELTKTVLEGGFLKEQDGAYVLDGPLPPLAIPSTLQDSLMARLDRLAAAKEVAQIGACIGRTFSRHLLASLVEAPEGELDGSISALVTSELIFVRHTPPTTSYTFRHALAQDAAYNSLLKTRRRAIHEKIAISLEEIEPNTIDDHPELLAHHWTMAEQAARAIPYWVKAGQVAARRSANLEALAHLEQGLALLGQLEDKHQRLRMELDLRTTFGATIMLVKGWFASEVQHNYDRLLSVSRDLGDDSALFRATWGLWLSNFIRGDVNSGLSLIDDMFVLAGKDQGNDDHALQAHHAAWGTLTWVAEYDAACQHATDGLAIYDPARHRDHATRYGGHDPGVCGHAQRGSARWFQGFPETAESDTARALDLANEICHENSILHAMAWRGLTTLFAREFANGMDMGQRVLEMATDRGLPMYQMFGALILGGTLAQGSEAAAGRERLGAVLARFDASGVGVLKFMVRGFYAESCRRIGDLDEAAQAIEAAITSSVAAGDVFWLPELQRVRGDILLARAVDNENVESSYRAAIDTARGQGSRSLELRAATSLAHLWRSQDKCQDAQDLLTPIHDWFTEGFDTPDLVEAKALLEELN
jgi:class 3 adenylate cyclase